LAKLKFIRADTLKKMEILEYLIILFLMIYGVYGGYLLYSMPYYAKNLEYSAISYVH